jgi:pyruvate,water dikinase
LFPSVTLGWKHGGERYGLPTGEARWAAVNGWIYYGPEVPLTAAELAAREPAAQRTLSSAPWREEVRRWHDEERPRAVAANKTLQTVDPASFADAALAAHFRAAVDNFLTSAPLHFAHTGFDVVAAQLFALARDAEVDPAAVVDLLAGASPATAAVDAHLRCVADAVRHDRGPTTFASLDEIRGVSGDVAAALDAYLDEYGWRPIAGHDLLEPTLRERPQLVVAAVNAAIRRPAPRAALRPPDVRDRIPEEGRARFDALLADARAAYALRDDDVGVCWNWPLGLVRRTARVIGDRAAGRGQVVDAEHVFEATVDEALALLGGRGPAADELARRWDTRVRAGRVEPPLHLDGGGDRPDPLPLPPTVAELAALREVVWRVAPTRVEAPLHGIGIGSERAAGPARVVRTPEDMDRIVEGDVLVTTTTTTAFNAVFPLLAGVVTQEGGLFSHTAILARELQLPAVVGVRELLDLVHDDDVIEIDPVAGTVSHLTRSGLNP